MTGYIKTRFSPLNIKEWYNELPIPDNDTDDSSDTEEMSEPDDEQDEKTQPVWVNPILELEGTSKPVMMNIDIPNRRNIVNLKRTNRSADWRNSILKRYRRCAVTGLDVLECDAAHIVPFKKCQGEKESWGTSKSNGLLLSKNLHWTFDRFYWSLDPNDFIEADNLRIWLRIIIRPTKRRLSILNYFKPQGDTSDEQTYGYVKVYKDNIPFIKIHYDTFLSIYNQKQVKEDRKKYNKSIQENIDQSSSYHIIKRKYDKSLESWSYLTTIEGKSFGDKIWIHEIEGETKYGVRFMEAVRKFNEEEDKREDPDWKDP